MTSSSSPVIDTVKNPKCGGFCSAVPDAWIEVRFLSISHHVAKHDAVTLTTGGCHMWLSYRVLGAEDDIGSVRQRVVPEVCVEGSSNDVRQPVVLDHGTRLPRLLQT
jgi:hypothetical protein